jgi:hypothetical protein
MGDAANETGPVVFIAGGRRTHDADALRAKLDELNPSAAIKSSRRGAPVTAEQWARENDRTIYWVPLAEVRQRFAEFRSKGPVAVINLFPNQDRDDEEFCREATAAGVPVYRLSE